MIKKLNMIKKILGKFEMKNNEDKEEAFLGSEESEQLLILRC